MSRGPEAASMEMVDAALGANGAAVCVELIRRLRHADKAIAEQAARTLKKISEANATALLPWRKQLLEAAFLATDVRVQWNLTIVLGRLPLKGRDKALAVDLIFERLQDKSGLNRTLAMQALMDLSEHDAALRARTLLIVRESLQDGTPAMKARARRLLGLKRRNMD